MAVECAWGKVWHLILHCLVMGDVFAGLREGQLLSSFWDISYRVIEKEKKR